MATNARGFAVFRSGWTGGVTLASSSDSVVVSASAHTSPLYFAKRVEAAGVGTIGSGFSFAVTAAGKISFSCSVAFSMTFTGNAGTRIGFSDSASASTHTAASVARGSVWPYDSDGMLYTLDVPIAMRPGYSLQQTAILTRTPGLDWVAPDAQIQATRKIALETIEAFEVMDTPAKMSILVEPNTVAHLHVGAVQVKTDDELSGWSTVSFEVAK